MTTTPEKLPISVLVQTKNEAKGIGACLAALDDFDEVVVVDSNSTDATAAIAKERGVSVVNFSWNGLYPKKKQWQLDNLPTRHNYVLFLDADEFPTSELLAELRQLKGELSRGRVAGFDVSLIYTFSGKRLKYGHRVTKRCLVHRAMVHFPVFDDLDATGMGELEGHYQPEARGPVRKLAGRLLHDDQDPVRSWFDRHNRYSDWEAFLAVRKDLAFSVRRSRSLQGQVFQMIPGKPFLFFLYSYILRAGFLDRRAGFDYAFALASYYWQVDLKIREQNRTQVVHDRA